MQVTKTTPLFAATLRPDRSFKTAGGWLALALAFIIGVPFLLAVPEFLVPGLVAYGLAGGGLAAFGMRQKRHSQHLQNVTLWPDQLEISDARPGVEKTMQRFKPADVKLRLARDEYERTTGIFLRHPRGELELGAFLGRNDKSSFAKAFGAALRQAKRGA